MWVGFNLFRVANNSDKPFRMAVPFNPETEVVSGGGAGDALSECARPRAQQLASFKPWNIFQPPVHHTWLRPGRPHSANAEIQLRCLGLTTPGENTR